ncbi:hypothetical protein TGAM01_v210214 [Trichoderma gamsii]|uniref:Uncharacterized protein n=1 Tax=Trichoderma gamsii TaxID=398673 RepID=A0A0W7VGY7_9HYPO|nr:hypothetical protein TGAM01_v210214 [Trichoderma gamsii]PNP41197.1 hypothetical protein TGAMA5MH_07067 [Trichoderma gamsii]PON20929.1 hypothetical protein TGAM01_v210214 [Trichoderma gamsii]
MLSWQRAVDDDSASQRSVELDPATATARRRHLDAGCPPKTPAWRAGPGPAQTIWAPTGSSLLILACGCNTDHRPASPCLVNGPIPSPYPTPPPASPAPVPGPNLLVHNDKAC